MRRVIARWQIVWLRLFVLAIVATPFLPIPPPFDLVFTATWFVVFLVRPPRSDRPPVDLAPPMRGRWVVFNSPGSAVPSHGVKAYGQAYAVDVLHPSPDASTSIGWSLRTRRPQSYSCFGEPVLAMSPGTVVRATGTQRDHHGRNTWPSIIWMLTIEAFVRELAGVSRILGNHVIVEHDDGICAAYAHLRHDSVTVRAGERVTAGQQVAEVGNTGNTSEPHLHVQLMDHPHPTAAAGVPMRWPDLIIDAAETDPRWTRGEPKPTALPDFPRNGQIFEARPS
jgi:hypothetical protein